MNKNAGLVHPFFKPQGPEIGGKQDKLSVLEVVGQGFAERLMGISRAADNDNVNAPDGFFQIGGNHIQLRKTVAGVAG